MPTKDIERAQTKPCVHQDQRSHRDWARPAFECLSVSCRGTHQQWPATGTGALAAADLGHTACSIALLEEVTMSPNIELPSRWPTKCRTIIPKKSHTVKKVLGPTTDFPIWGSGKGPENPQGIWPWRPVGLGYRTSTGLGKQTLGGHKQNLANTRTHEQGAVSSQTTEPDLPVSVQEPLEEAEAWIESGLLQGQGHWIKQCGRKSFGRRSPLPQLPLS